MLMLYWSPMLHLWLIGRRRGIWIWFVGKVCDWKPSVELDLLFLYTRSSHQSKLWTSRQCGLTRSTRLRTGSTCSRQWQVARDLLSSSCSSLKTSNGTSIPPKLPPDKSSKWLNLSCVEKRIRNQWQNFLRELSPWWVYQLQRYTSGLWSRTDDMTRWDTEHMAPQFESFFNNTGSQAQIPNMMNTIH